MIIESQRSTTLIIEECTHNFMFVFRGVSGKIFATIFAFVFFITVHRLHMMKFTPFCHHFTANIAFKAVLTFVAMYKFDVVFENGYGCVRFLTVFTKITIPPVPIFFKIG